MTRFDRRTSAVMLAAALALLVLQLTGCAPARAQEQEEGRETLSVPAGTRARCAAEGGCMLVTRAQVAELDGVLRACARGRV